jgi:hypothetical protein
MEDFIEPNFIKAGDTRLLINGNPPLVDCRVIAESNYQRLIHASQQNEALQAEIEKLRRFNLNQDDRWRIGYERLESENEALKTEIERLNERLDKDINALLHLGMAKDEQIERLKNIIKDGKLGN